MDVRLSPEQELLRASARELLARECPPARVREWLEAGPRATDTLWQRIVEAGWPGLVVPEAHGGAGLGLLDLALVLEETGRALAPGPFFSVALGALAVARLGTPEQQQRLLPGIASGELRATFAHAQGRVERRPDGGAGDAGVQLRRGARGMRLHGTKRFVHDVEAADRLLVPADDGTVGAALVLIDPRAPGVALRRIAHVDLTRRVYQLRLDDVPVDEDALLLAPAQPEPGLVALLDAARVARCAEMTGCAQRVLELSVEYAKTREQFGRPIGSFQAIAHRCADMLVRVEAARSATWWAAWSFDAAGDPAQAHTAACMAKAWCAEAGPWVAGQGIQIHGGLGFTWDADLHLFYKRALADAATFGDATWCHEEVARALLDEAGASETQRSSAGSVISTAGARAAPSIREAEASARDPARSDS